MGILSFFRKESTNAQDQIRDMLSSIKGGFFYDKFAQSIFDDKVLNIHEEKRACKSIERHNAWIGTAIDNLVNIIFGDKPKIVSKSEKLVNYANNYWIVDSGFKRAEKEAVSEAVKSGDGYVEIVETQSGYPKYFNIENAENMYIDYDYEKNKPLRYILKFEVDEIIAKELKLKSFTIKQPYGMITFYGKEFEPSKIIHYKFGNNTWGVYGRSPTARVLKDVELLNIAERSIAIVSKYKAVPKQIITGISNTPDGILTQHDIDILKNVLTEAGDTKTPIYGKKLEVTDTSQGGKDINLKDYVDYLKRKITIIYNPEFIMHGENVNRASSKEQKQTFYLSVGAIRDQFLPTSNEEVFQGLIKQISSVKKRLKQEKKKVLKRIKKEDVGELLDADFVYEYGEFAIELPDERNIRLLEEFKAGVITLNEYRELMEYPKDEERGDVYFWEVRSPESQLNPQDLL